ncbi:hypothetical protein KFK09_016988 [Dendrobium nobile]|uniref:Uncharacterized protein n=1 Tax=Dendrobium nobile TaxID=94219 RepID=A0A8T3AZU3_DENNO|nr:hypothetical protein KFK09_016988 [Dendrobium nobile]
MSFFWGSIAGKLVICSLLLYNDTWHSRLASQMNKAPSTKPKLFSRGDLYTWLPHGSHVALNDDLILKKGQLHSSKPYKGGRENKKGRDKGGDYEEHVSIIEIKKRKL